MPIELINRDGSKYQISINDKIYELDISEVEKSVYSVIVDNQSIDVELVSGRGNKAYVATSGFNSFDVEIIDAESKYQLSRKKDDGEDSNIIASPMPGKVVKILFKEGDSVKAGETIIVVSAMKMESEYKVKQDRIIKRILVKEGDTVIGDQPMVIIE